MFEEAFEKLSSGEKETFRRVVAGLFSHSFLLSHNYNASTGERVYSQDYRFALTNFELLEDYFDYAGITLSRDTGSGVIYLSAFPAAQRVHFDKLTTLLCYTLRLVYMEGREELSLSSVVMLTVGELVEKMTTLGLLKGRIARTQIRDSLRTLVRYNLVAKGAGGLDDKSTRLAILPSIAFVISEERLSSLARIAREEEGEEESEETE